jgi:hypothetical protein
MGLKFYLNLNVVYWRGVGPGLSPDPRFIMNIHMTVCAAVINV